MIIDMPARIDYESILEFKKSLNLNLHEADQIVINFENMRYSYPLPMLVLGSCIRKFIIQRNKYGNKTCFCGVKDYSAHSYLKHIGFFNYTFVHIGKEMGEAKGSSTYLPIRELDKNELLCRINPPYINLRYVINEESKQIALIILGERNKSGLSILCYCIREIIRNSFEHSESSKCYICAQKWYNDSVEIAILDEGIGIRKSLSSRHVVLTDFDAIKEAIQPGISSKHIESLENNIYDNSGFGLYVLSEIGKSFGWFAIGSGLCRIKYEKETPRTFDDFDFNGTFVGLHLNSLPNDFKKVLDGIIYNGEQEAYMMGRNIKASSSSKEFDSF